MRYALVRNVLAATTMVALAFVIPLGLLAKQIAYDRALSDARQHAAAVIAAMAAVGADRPAVSRAVATMPDASDRVAVFLPDETPIGESRAADPDIGLAQDRVRSVIADVDDGLVFLQPTVLESADTERQRSGGARPDSLESADTDRPVEGSGGGSAEEESADTEPGDGSDQDRTAVVEVFVPDDELWRGVWPAWLAMGGLAIALVAGSVVLADRLGAQLVAAARRLARAARAFGSHDLTARVEPAGPPELAEVGRAFNTMAGQLVAMVDAERERAADMSHRLRTPLTALRLEAEALPASAAADRIRDSLHVLETEVDAIITNARRPVAHPDGEASDLVDVLAARLAFWTVLAEHQDRPWQVLGSDEPVWLDVSRADLSAAIDALISNVFRHTQPRTSFQVTVGPDALVVEDAGPGIADVEAAVQRGVSGSDSTGLGLDIVHAVATQVGGRVDIDNGSLGGARVTVTLR
jgi:signal transduction histidine kinase